MTVLDLGSAPVLQLAVTGDLPPDASAPVLLHVHGGGAGNFAYFGLGGKQP